MATIRFGGYFYVLNEEGFIDFNEAEMTWIVADYVTDFSYTVLVNSGPISEITVNWDGFQDVSITNDTQDVDVLGADMSLFLGTYVWSNDTGAKQSDIFDAELSDTSGFVFVLDGDELPDLTTAAASKAWLGSVTEYTWVTEGALIPDEETPIRELSGAVTYEDGVTIGTSQADNIIRGFGQDTVRASAGDDFISGGAGNDRLHGHQGDDELFGGLGDDRMRGGSGADLLTGGAGNDIMRGGQGADSFIFDVAEDTGFDRIKDFEDGLDHLVFTGGAQFSDMRLIDHAKGVLVVTEQAEVLLVGIDQSQITADDFIFA